MHTTIRIRKDIKERLDAFRAYPKQTYESIIEELTKKEVDKNDGSNTNNKEVVRD